MKSIRKENIIEGLITVIPSFEVPQSFKCQTSGWKKWRSRDQHQDPPGSGKFYWEAMDYFEERILVECGRATVTPNDGSPAVTFGEGDVVIFRKGLTCTWQIHQPMEWRHCSFDRNGEELEISVGIICDMCGTNCSDLSYEVSPDDLDLCLSCFVKTRSDYLSAKKLEEGTVVSIQDCTIVKPESSRKLIRVIPANKVSEKLISMAAGWCKWESKNHPQQPPNSGTFQWTYDDWEEKIFVERGRAIITPDDGSPAISFGKGDFVIFPRGLTCIWEVQEPIVKRFCYFNEKGEVVGGGEIRCDFCSRDCSTKSYTVFPGELDLCPLCFQARGAYYVSAKRLEKGIVAEEIRVEKDSVSPRMDRLITVIRAAEVSDDLRKDATGWRRWYSEDQPQSNGEA